MLSCAPVSHTFLCDVIRLPAILRMRSVRVTAGHRFIRSSDQRDNSDQILFRSLRGITDIREGKRDKDGTLYNG